EDGGLEVPARGIEPGRVRAQGIQHLFHQIAGGERLLEGDGPDGRVGQERQVAPARVEEIAIPGDLLGALHLGEVEVDALPAPRLGAAGEEQGQGRAEDGGGDGSAVHRDVRLVQVKPTLAVHEERQLPGRDAIVPAARGVSERELAYYGGTTDD